MFWITVGVLEDAVVNAHGQSGDVARRRGDLDAFVESGDVSGLKSSTAGSGDADPLRVHIGAREQVIECSNAVPNLPASQIRACQIGQISDNGMLATNQVVTALACFRIPELAALALSDGIPGEHHVAPQRQLLSQILVMQLADGRVPAGNQHGWMFSGAIVGYIHQRRDIYSGKAFENQLLYMKLLHLNSPGDTRVQRRFFCRQTSEHP